MIPYYVLPSDVKNIWPHCAPYIAQGLDPSQGEVDLRHVLASLESGTIQLIAAIGESEQVCGALVVEFVRFPNYQVAHIITVSGKGMIFAKDGWEHIRCWLRDQGATKVQGLCLPAQTRLWKRLGFKETYKLVRLDL